MLPTLAARAGLLGHAAQQALAGFSVSAAREFGTSLNTNMKEVLMEAIPKEQVRPCAYCFAGN